MSADRLYSPQMLAAAVELAQRPALGAPALEGQARSPTCGSTIAVGLDCDGEGRIRAIGLTVRACAVGQAAAAVFARHAPGRDVAAISLAHDRIVAWLGSAGAMPDWPDFDLIAPARDFPGRHGAMVLPWRAAIAAMGQAGTSALSSAASAS